MNSATGHYFLTRKKSFWYLYPLKKLLLQLLFSANMFTRFRVVLFTLVEMNKNAPKHNWLFHCSLWRERQILIHTCETDRVTLVFFGLDIENVKKPSTISNFLSLFFYTNLFKRKPLFAFIFIINLLPYPNFDPCLEDGTK
jgi:hypothetical protein